MLITAAKTICYTVISLYIKDICYTQRDVYTNTPHTHIYIYMYRYQHRFILIGKNKSWHQNPEFLLTRRHLGDFHEFYFHFCIVYTKYNKEKISIKTLLEMQMKKYWKRNLMQRSETNLVTSNIYAELWFQEFIFQGRLEIFV